MVDRTKPAVVDVSDNETVVSTVRSFLYGVYVNTALSAHALPIKDGTGGTTLVTIPASAAAGSHYPIPGIEFASGIAVDPDDVATGNVTVAWNREGA